jgi:hypothetical protein
VGLLKVYLDGNLVPEPIGLDEISEHLYYSETLISYLTEVDGNLTFTGDEYDYIRNVFNNSVCATIEIRIVAEDNFEIDFEGLINVADVKFIPDKKFAVCEVQNNNITSRIDNNKSIECNLTAGKTKNDISYSVTQQTITVPDPTDSNTITRDGIRIFDAFTSIIAFLTDGEIGFVSDYFNYNTNTGAQVYSVLMTGKELRTGGGNYPTISFEDLFNDLNGLENLAMAFDNGSIRIENKEYFKQQSSSVTFENVNDLAQSLATETLFAKVSFGSFQTLGEFNYLQDIRFNGMQKEEYHLGGQCNTDTELKLEMRNIITDTNIIQDVIPSAGGMGGNDNDNYDDSVLIIHCDSSNKVQLTQKPASGTDFYFNDRFTNRNVALRWLGQIPQSIYAFLGSGNDGCFINDPIGQNNLSTLVGYVGNQSSPLPYNDVNSNYQVATRWFPYTGYTNQQVIDWGTGPSAGGILFNNSMDVGIYTAPANAVYSFEIDVLSTLSQPAFFGKMEANSPSAGWGCIFVDSEPIGGGLFRYFGGASFYMNAGEYVGFSINNGLYEYEAGSTFKVFDPLGGVWQTYDAATVYNIQNQITYPINIEDWKDIKQDPYKSMGITHQSGVQSGWLKDIKRNLKTGNSEITLLGRKDG